jgi:hypothetical protein
MTRPQRPRLTLKIMFYAIFDVVGMVFLASGALWFARGQSLFIPDFPRTMVGALASIIGGFLLMLWAAAQILRELIKRPDNVVEEGK